MGHASEYEVVVTYHETWFEQVVARCRSFEEARQLGAALLKHTRLRPARAWVRRRTPERELKS